MKKVQLFISVLSFSIMILVSCAYQENSKIVEGNDTSKIQNETLSNLQIGQNIFEIFEDNQGKLWFGITDDGVARYDGQKLKYFSEEDGLCGKTVANIAQDKEGTIWLGTYSDMCRFKPIDLNQNSHEQFMGFDKNPEGVPLLGYGWKSVKTDKKGNIWVNSHHGIFQYIDDAFVEFEVPTPKSESFSFCSTPGVISMDLIDSKGNMWFGTDGDGVYMYDGKTFKNISNKDGLLSNNIVNIQEDSKGAIWFACTKSPDSRENEVGGVCKYDGSTFTYFNHLEGLYDNNINTIYADKSDNIWVGATKFGVYCFTNNNATFYPEPTIVNHADSFNISGLQSILEDSTGRIWLGYSGGLFRIDNKEIINITKSGPWL